MCGYLNKIAMFLEVCSCGLFNMSAANSHTIPHTVSRTAPHASSHVLRDANIRYKNIHDSPPGKISSSLNAESTSSSNSVYSCNSFDENPPDINKNTSSYFDWTFVKCLNENPQSKIDVMKNSNTNEKCIRKLYFKTNKRNFCKYGYNEWKIVSELSHPNIIKFDYFHQFDKFVAILMPYYKTDLFNKLEIDSTKSYFTSPSSISERLDTLLSTYSTIKYIHDCGVVHRDIKPENFVLNDCGVPILIDFGFAVKTHDKMLLNDKKGTRLYVAPEVYLDDPFDGKSADIFSLGSMSWIIIFGCQPWNNNRTDSFYETIYNMPVNDILKDFQKLVKEMTSDNPNKRPNISECVKRLNDINTAYFSCEDVMNEFLLLPD